MKRQKIVEDDIVHVTHRPTIEHFAGEPVGRVVSVGKFDGLTPDPTVRRDKKTGEILSAFFVQTQFGMGVYARSEIKICRCKEHYAAIEAAQQEGEAS